MQHLGHCHCCVNYCAGCHHLPDCCLQHHHQLIMYVCTAQLSISNVSTATVLQMVAALHDLISVNPEIHINWTRNVNVREMWPRSRSQLQSSPTHYVVIRLSDRHKINQIQLQPPHSQTSSMPSVSCSQCPQIRHRLKPFSLYLISNLCHGLAMPVNNTTVGWLGFNNTFSTNRRYRAIKKIKVC